MSEQDFNAGHKGREWSPMMDRQDYESGQQKRKAEEGIMGGNNGPKTEVDGVGFVQIVMAQILGLMYPIAGATTMASCFATVYLADHLFKNHAIKIILLLVVGFTALVYSLKLEHKASEFKAYRIFRHIFRLIAVGGITFNAIIGRAHHNSYSAAFNHAAPGALAASILAIALMHWLFPKLDQHFFPVMDDKAKKEAKEFEGMSDEEIFEVKHAQFVGKRNFALAWLVSTLVLGGIFHHGVSVVLLAAITFAVCFKFRNKWFFKTPEKKANPAEWVGSSK